jgi:hypothetical protein
VSPRQPGNPKLGTSAKLALQRALTVTAKRGQRRITIANLLLGLLALAADVRFFAPAA